MRRPPAWLDALAGLFVAALAAALAVKTLYSRNEWYDWIAYALPAANLSARGALSLPQLGEQLGFDRGWLFSAPWMALGPWPFYALAGVGRMQYLAGALVSAFASTIAVTWAARRGLKLRSWTLTALVAYAFLGDRIYASSFANQRYDFVAYAALVLAFAPLRSAWASALAAGALPLLHPATIPLSGLWLLLKRPPPRVLAWYVAPLVPAAFWYGRVESLRTQFLPHVTYHVGGEGIVHQVFAGLRMLPSSVAASVPTLALGIAVSALALGLLATGARRRPLPAAAIAFSALLLWDAVIGFRYLRYGVVGVGPCLLFGIADPRARRWATAVFAALGVAHLAVGLKMDRAAAPSFATQREALSFVVEHTRPGDRIVLAPPFVLASAPAELPEGRRVVGVVPMTFYVKGFDAQLYRTKLAAAADVYVGSAEWYDRTTIVPSQEADLFPAGEPQLPAEFYGEPVAVIRASR